MAAAFSVEPNVYLRRLLGVVAVIMLVGGLPLFARIAGFQFLPTEDWVRRVWWVALSVGIFFAVVPTIVYARGWSRMAPEDSSVKHVFVLIFMPFLGVSIGMDSVLAGGPLIYTALAGHPAETRFVVARAEGFSDRKCRNKIELKDMPFMYDALCGFPKDFRDSLPPGQTLIVSGRGSFAGTFISSVRVAEQ
ncbi:hypothetical protein [Tabrizicola sp.]|jgi:hypothetical protein|uniref:hypothetical protein n=1 Tax=Tabrizicola sp. TaxID=2005166 RepID=UPI0035B048BB